MEHFERRIRFFFHSIGTIYVHKVERSELFPFLACADFIAA
jgi:hypothetical protein